MRIKLNPGEAEDGGFMIGDNIHVTSREIQALIMVGLGFENRVGAEKLGISETTFRNHAHNVMKKLGAKNRAHAIALAVDSGMIEIKGDDLNRGLNEASKSRYVLCMMCGRASRADEFEEQEPEHQVINHVGYDMPQMPKCPYEECKGDITYTIDWDLVRWHRPDYPEKPKRGIVYDYDLKWYIEEGGRMPEKVSEDTNIFEGDERLEKDES